MDDIKTVDDQYGNLIRCCNNGRRIVLSLKLAAEKRARRLGFINISTQTFFVRRNSKKHLFIKLNAYGFNYKILSETSNFDKVRLDDEKFSWIIPVKYILENGVFLNFLNKGGFELQIFISLSKIESYKRNKNF